MTHHTMNDILSDENIAAHKCVLTLKAGDSAEHPESAKPHRQYRGPCKVVYAIYPDGVHASVLEAPMVAYEALQDALKAWQPLSDEDDGSEGKADALYAGSLDVVKAAKRIASLIERGHFVADELDL